MKLAVIGLGYVGLPLALAFEKRSNDEDVIGFDVNLDLIKSLRNSVDPAGEVKFANGRVQVFFTDASAELRDCEVYVIAVPTPIDETKRPNLDALKAATRMVGEKLGKGALVVYESTVYPGCTEDLCIPILEEASGLKVDEDFDVAYSPERVVPGDAAHSLENVTKLVAARRPEAMERVTDLYESITEVHQVKSIRAAEAAKVLENTQRDLNIALMNECALIFDRAGIDTQEVIDAAATKWNFHPYRPGLVGGHCIGVDPYYLTHMAERLGYRPEVILAGRHINDSMGRYVARQCIRLLNRDGVPARGARVAVLGLTFKEDVKDLRNSRVLDLVEELRAQKVEVLLQDPLADPKEIEKYYGDTQASWRTLSTEHLDGLVLAVPHRHYEDLEFWNYLQEVRVVLDVKGRFPQFEERPYYWRL